MNNRVTIYFIISFLVVFPYLVYRTTKKFRDCPILTETTCLKSHDMKKLYQSYFHPMMVQLTIPKTFKNLIENKTGLEIGAPSLTWQEFGIYNYASNLDVAHFSRATIWEGNVPADGSEVTNGNVKGKQYIRDAVDLHGIKSSKYDFFCASDVLEHIANPFKALLEWKRVLRPGGLMILILPLKEATFDHKREVSKIEHLIDDYLTKTTEADSRHVSEILQFHDVARDPEAASLDNFRRRSEKNQENRALHQHVFDQRLLYYMFRCLNLDVRLQMTWDFHQLIIGQKH